MGKLSYEYEKPTVLIADDDPSTRMLLRASITQWDYSILEAADGEEAWNILQNAKRPHIVTVDWMMPKIDGLSLCRLAKTLPFPPYMILLTSMSGTSNLVHALDAGADDFLTKPFNFAELRSRLYVGQRLMKYAYQLKSGLASTINLEKLEVLNQIQANRIRKLSRFIKTLNQLTGEQAAILQQMISELSTQQKELSNEIKRVDSLK